MHVEIDSLAEVPQVRATVRAALLERCSPSTADAAATVTSEFLARLAYVAASPYAVAADCDGDDVRLQTTASLRISRAEALQRLQWDDSTFGGIVVGELVREAGVEFEPDGTARIWARVAGG